MNIGRGFLLLSIIAFILPIILGLRGFYLVGWDLAQSILDIENFFGSVFGQIVAVGYFISGLSLVFFAIYEANARSDYYLLWVIPVATFLGIGVALPFYLYLRLPKRD